MNFTNLQSIITVFILAVSLPFLGCDTDSPIEKKIPTNNRLSITENVNGELTKVEGIPC